MIGVKRSRRPKLIMLTNFGLPEYRRDAESFGIEAFLDKSCGYFRLILRRGVAHSCAREAMAT
jgi:hypothetical protein